MMLQFEGMVATGTAALDSGIGDTALKTFNGITYLYSLTGAGGGIASWQLTESMTPQAVDQVFYNPPITGHLNRDGILIDLAGVDQLILPIRTASGLVGYELNDDGTLGVPRESDALAHGGDFSAAAQLSIGSLDLLSLAYEDTGQILTYRIGNDGTLNAVGTISADADILRSLHSGSDQYLITIDTDTSSIATFSVDGVTGALGETPDSDITALGIAAPTAAEVIEAYGKSWVIVAGSASNSLSVMKLDADGRLTPTDHVLDTLHTRFQSVQDISVVSVEGHVFVLAGGGDDGISLFRMTPDGRLIHQDSFADTLSSGLQNVETLSAAHIGSELQIFAASQVDPGLTQLSVQVANLGEIRQGFGTVNGTERDDILSGGILDTSLDGGAGDDLLITGTSATTMTGGSGADTFILRETSGHTTITDFQVGIDRLNLTDYPFLRSPAQLEITSTANGARIRYRDESIDIISDTGETLTSTDIFGAGFDGADHIPVNLGNDPDNNAAPGVSGPVSINSETANPALVGAQVQFTPNGGAMIASQANSNGEFELDIPDGTYSGDLNILKSYSTASGEITALDALQALRISVGLDPLFGPAKPENLIAADLTRDGTINALDALAILQAAVDQPSAHKPEWVFLDADTDLSAITRTNVDYDTGTSITVVDGAFTADFTSILLGNIEAV